MRNDANRNRDTESNAKKAKELTMDSYDLLKEILEQDKASLERKKTSHSGSNVSASPSAKSSPGKIPSQKTNDKTAEEEKLLREILAQLKELNSAIKAINPERREQNDILDKVKVTPSENDEAFIPMSEDPTANKEFTDQVPLKKKKKFRWIGELLFYLVLIMMIVGAFLIKSNSGGRPTIIAGYSAFTVLTGSMQDEIPQGSLVITKAVDAKTLEIGDDITYMVSETASITHRIIGITESYQSTGERAFETQGIMNAKPDKELVPAANVVGKVVFHSEILGQIASFATKNWPFLLFLVTVIVILIFVLKWLLKDKPPDETDSGPPKDKSKPKITHTKNL